MSNMFKSAIRYFQRKIEQYFDIIRVFFSLLYTHLVENKAIVFIATPIYGNLGDHAIIRSQIKFVSDQGFGKKIVEVSSSQYLIYKCFLAKIIRDTDVIAIDGGGNMGTLWLNEETKMRDIIRMFPHNQIIIFPQTAYFEETKSGEEELNRSVNIYNAHNNLTIFCRDQNTYQLIQNRMPNVKSYYVPDIVLYTNDAAIDVRRNGISICMRDDLERINSVNVEKVLSDRFPGKELRMISTMYLGKISRKNREPVLFQKWREFSESELVITDRLHGMLFSAITGTPCIAIDNKSHKVKQGYEWIKSLSYIVFCDGDIAEKLDYVDGVMGQNFRYDRTEFSKFFSIIAEVLDSALEI